MCIYGVRESGKEKGEEGRKRDREEGERGAGEKGTSLTHGRLFHQ